MKTLSFILIFFLYGCQKCPVIPASTENFSSISLGVCFNTNLPSKEYVIENESDLKKLYNTLGCNSTIPSIDFSKFSLIGAFTSGKCKTEIQKSVTLDNLNKTYTYNLSVCEKGSCKSQSINMNWILIDKLKTGYVVKFSIVSK